MCGGTYTCYYWACTLDCDKYPSLLWDPFLIILIFFSYGTLYDGGAGRLERCMRSITSSELYLLDLCPSCGSCIALPLLSFYRKIITSCGAYCLLFRGCREKGWFSFFISLNFSRLSSWKRPKYFAIFFWLSLSGGGGSRVADLNGMIRLEQGLC